MKAVGIFRYSILAAILVCAVPPIVLALGWLASQLAACRIDLKDQTVCTNAHLDLAAVIDALVPVAIHAPLTAGLAVYLFAIWVGVELLLIIITSLGRT